ncbi:hypothetical protein CspeluHIS016_0307810 [Cutaneotrichosporon spelunceum]|uniref:Uncharacterized protein n=1 Tax=Cutaneotrichosporon spelunceum TaxID=1672016 RepID=A0AAD3TUV2_9TREE|nr:hypothetical protein CspeluHIS016_0307810 [Cutaneotrichosporon spelunceum]
MPHPHPSTSSHIATETALLQLLHTRSKAQHRSQPFLSRLHAVIRLSKRVLAALPPREPHASPSSSHADPYARTLRLLPTFASALVRAAAASAAILELHHFVPLHTALLAAYARLLAVTAALGAALGMHDLLADTSGSGRVKRAEGGTTVGGVGRVVGVGVSEDGVGEGRVGEVGEVVARQAPTRPASVQAMSREREALSERAHRPREAKKKKATDMATSGKAVGAVGIRANLPLPSSAPPSAGGASTPTPTSTPNSPNTAQNNENSESNESNENSEGAQQRRNDGAGEVDKRKRAEENTGAQPKRAGIDGAKKNKKKAGDTSPAVSGRPKKRARSDMDDIFETKAKTKTKTKSTSTPTCNTKPKTTPTTTPKTKTKRKPKGTIDDIFGF